MDLRHHFALDPFPESDGWARLYRRFARLAPAVQRAVCRYFWPTTLERWRGGKFYDVLGVGLFGSVIPTGGIRVRRLTKSRMAPYTLSGTSVAGARAFYYKTCVFEFLHLPFFLALVGLAIHRALIGRVDLALENTAVNLLFNIYPIMHHRRPRMRIVRLLSNRVTPGGR
jgi:hypothetical protein